MQSLHASASDVPGTSGQDRRKTPPPSTWPPDSSNAGGRRGGALARVRTYASAHKTTLAAIAVVTLTAGYAGAHAVRALRARRKVQEALARYQDAEAALEAAEARGWLGIGRKKTALERAEENF